MIPHRINKSIADALAWFGKLGYAVAQYPAGYRSVNG